LTENRRPGSDAEGREGGPMTRRRWLWPIKLPPDKDDNAIFIVAAFVAAGIILFILTAIF
jgi:hypothetical protein